MEKEKIRTRCKDMFHAFLVEGAEFDGYYDIPFIPQKEYKKISRLIPYDETAKAIYSAGDAIHFYMDDQKFDGPKGVWNGLTNKNDSSKGFKVSRFQGVDTIISPDFSLYLDMPRCMQIWNVYRSRAIGYYLSTLGYIVIPNVRWTDEESYKFAFAGIYKGSVVAVGTLGCAKNRLDKILFVNGFIQLIKRIQPGLVIIYGSVFKELYDVLILYSVKYLVFESKITLAYKVKTHGNEE